MNVRERPVVDERRGKSYKKKHGRQRMAKVGEIYKREKMKERCQQAKS